MKNKFKDRSNYATWLGPSCKLCPAVAVVPCTQMYNSEVCHHQRGNKGVFCYQTFLKSICFLIHPKLLTYLEVVEKKMNCTPRTWVGYSVGDKISKMSLLSTKIERRVCRMSSVLCMWLSSQRAGGVLERSLLSASREGVTAATRTAADPKSGPALKPCRLSLWWAGGIYSKLIKMLTKRILLLSNCFWSGKIWTGWD